jgi:hypothetical protein
MRKVLPCSNCSASPAARNYRRGLCKHLPLAAAPFANSDRTEPLAVIYRRAKKLTPAMKNFINALKQPVPASN